MAKKGLSVKTMKRMLKKAGLKVSGKKATLTRRAKKARLLKGGENPYGSCEVEGKDDPNISKADCVGEGKKWVEGAAPGFSNSAPGAMDVEGGRRRRKY